MSKVGQRILTSLREAVTMAELQAEITRLRAELAAVTAERDRMREALSYYAEENYNGYNGSGACARAAIEGVMEPASPWRDIETAPKDGTPVEGSEMYRYLPYKPEGRRQMKADGRWQRWNGYGWENSEPPHGWKTLPEPPR